MAANGTLVCNRSVYGNDPASGKFKMCLCRADGQEYSVDTSTASADYKPLAVVSADTSATEISEFESDGYEMSSAVDCVHWILAIEIPLVALSLLSQSHVLLLGNLLVGELIPGEVEVSQIAKSELTTVIFRIDTENLDETVQGIGNISFAEMKAWGIETVKPVDATIAAGMSVMDFAAPEMIMNPEITAEEKDLSAAVLLSCQFGWLSALLACFLQA